MQDAAVAGALIVQPINHKHDHSYVKHVIDTYPDKFKAMCLADPTLAITKANNNLKARQEEGFVGVRFNPSLWPEGETMSNKVGSSMFKKAGNLGMPVGIMCFKGLDPHLADIEALLSEHPKTKCIIDHMGFMYQDDTVLDSSWEKLHKLAKYPQVYVKVSAFARNSEFEYPFTDLTKHIEKLISVFGCNRLLFGSDFPFVLEEEAGGYYENSRLLYEWGLPVSVEELDQLTSGTAEDLFGKWG
uniref:Amidohydrolase-related domain-containing protein n=2 Tax=Octactis speculum TaxID=3111310 RepID=A0A7S2CKL7_9STRA|mmetsp:Transcript_37288/g.50454  ORF Transcript_37288/g.50454 Transcript_37288/m.50454 type:complete len:244 (+) Transcript_37288:89-820(+)